MPHKRLSVPYDKNRVLLSDVLPYEVPLTYSNKHIREFVAHWKIEIHRDKLSWLDQGPAIDWVVRFLFAVPKSVPIKSEMQTIRGELTAKKYVLLETWQFNTIPFAYKIAHKKSELRELCIPHPQVQLRVVEFYDRFKELISYYCSVSPFSIRRPTSVARQYFHRDRTHYERLLDDRSAIELERHEYQNLRSFFTYRDYSIIHKFYESYRYLRCEKKYNNLSKLDITKCFDSIYTHSITWATHGKNVVKENIVPSKSTFAGKFDALMQNANYLETNGIIIGPEFSRIFAEIILQAVDVRVQTILEKSHQMLQNIDYEAFRYVDDYFVFFNEASVAEQFLETLQVVLKEYKLSINATKSQIYEKPIITELSQAKRRVSDLLETNLSFELRPNPNDAEAEPEFHCKIGAKSLITLFKTLVFETKVQYRDILNYSLSIVERKFENILKGYAKSTKSDQCRARLFSATMSTLEFSFFIYSASPRVNSTIKICLLLRTLVPFFKAPHFDRDAKHHVFKYIFDQITFVMRLKSVKNVMQVETLYLLICLRELGKEYWLDEAALAKYFNIKKGDKGYFGGENLNYFSITVLLFYMREKKRYHELRIYVESLIVSKVATKTTTMIRDAETMFLSLDSIACPYLQDKTKITLLENLGVSSSTDQNEIINLSHITKPDRRQLYFTDWDQFDFAKALDMKRGQEVY